MLICDRMQSWFELWVLKSLHVNCFKSWILFSPLLPCSPSYNRSPVEPGEHFFCESPLLRLSQLLEQPDCLESRAGSEAHRTRWLSPPSPRPADGLSNRAVPTTTALLPRLIFAFGQQCLRSSASLPLLRLLLASCPALLPSFALTPVIGWFLTVSLLLLSHSDASVVAVENRYPCLFFFCYYPD